MTKPTNQQIVDALKASLEFLSPIRFGSKGKPEYICWALSLAESRGRITPQVCRHVQGIICERISPEASLKKWLYFQHGIPADALNRNNGRDMQEHRRAWVNQLIEEFSR
jgi:hypothetical protein